MGLLFNRTSKKIKNVDEEILLDEKKDRRLTPDVPSDKRTNIDRRGDEGDANTSFEDLIHDRKAGIRYIASFPVTVIPKKNGRKTGEYVINSRDI